MAADRGGQPSAFAEAIGYAAPGTAEFLVDGPDVYFLELNGRIQVEHPVTEAVTGLDIVELQLRVAAGDVIDPDVASAGHAIEARLYAEDPRDVPAPGRPYRPARAAAAEFASTRGSRRVTRSARRTTPAREADRARADTRGGDRRLTHALDETVVGGVTTNLPFLRWLVAPSGLQGRRLSTAFLLDHAPLSARPHRPAPRAFARRGGSTSPPGPGTRPGRRRRLSRCGTRRRHGSITAPMPGTVIGVEVSAGDGSTARQTLVVLEAMKMEMPVAAPFAATVTAVHVEPGDHVAAGTLLVELG